VEKHEVSRSDYDARESEAIATGQAVEADRAILASTSQEIAQARTLVTQRQVQVDAAQTVPQQASSARAQSQSAAGHVKQAIADLQNSI
jgi:membrane fusion protein, multidrug efflux system